MTTSVAIPEHGDKIPHYTTDELQKQLHMCFSSFARTPHEVAGTEILRSTRGLFVAGPTLTDR